MPNKRQIHSVGIESRDDGFVQGVLKIAAKLIPARKYLKAKTVNLRRGAGRSRPAPQITIRKPVTRFHTSDDGKHLEKQTPIDVAGRKLKTLVSTRCTIRVLPGKSMCVLFTHTDHGQ